jgi:hypothetical protein
MFIMLMIMVNDSLDVQWKKAVSDSVGEGGRNTLDGLAWERCDREGKMRFLAGVCREGEIEQV